MTNTSTLTNRITKRFEHKNTFNTKLPVSLLLDIKSSEKYKSLRYLTASNLSSKLQKELKVNAEYIAKIFANSEIPNAPETIHFAKTLIVIIDEKGKDYTQNLLGQVISDSSNRHSTKRLESFEKLISYGSNATPNNLLRELGFRDLFTKDYPNKKFQNIVTKFLTKHINNLCPPTSKAIQGDNKCKLIKH